MFVQIEPPKLPLPSNALSSGLAYPHRIEIEEIPDDHGDIVSARDDGRCVVCGVSFIYPEVCRIAPIDKGREDESMIWRELRQNGYVPEGARLASQEPRNYFMLCITHCIMFENFRFFIRYVPEQRKYIFINHSQYPDPLCKDYHGKALALDIDDPLAPFPISFLLHELRVRASVHQLFHDHQAQTIAQVHQDNVGVHEGHRDSTPTLLNISRRS